MPLARPRLPLAWLTSALLLLHVTSGCTRSNRGTADPVASTPRAARSGQGQAEPAASSSAERSTPGVVVVVIADQLGAEELLRAEPLLSPSGGLGRAMREGSYFERARYPYSATLTAPGHASLFTGTPPRVHGVSSNEVWHYETGAERSATLDATAKVLGNERHAGPAALRSETVPEMLSQATAGAKLLALSLKDRGAIFPLGRAGLALWYEPSTGGFTTSTAYANELPAWLTRAQQAHPLSALLVPWQPLVAGGYETFRGPDDAPWEASMEGFGRAFPHDPRRTSKPFSTLRWSPELADHAFRLARAAVESDGFGTDDTTDLVVLSISGLDYAGHAFGPLSWEYLDHLLRIDRALGELIGWLEQRGRVAMMVSADHGIAPAPESVPNSPGGRVYTTALTEQLNQHLEQRFGKGPRVEAFIGPFVYLSPSAKPRAEVIDAAARWLESAKGVARVLDVAAVRRGEMPDPLAERVAKSLGPDVAADLYVVQKPYFLLDRGGPPGVGSHHGSPHPYDTDVPILIWGHGVPQRRASEPVSALRFAATLSRLVSAPSPPQAEQPPLF